jgi:putative transposase
MPKLPKLPIPRQWNSKVRSAVLRVVSLANYAITSARAKASQHWNPVIRLQAELDRAEQELELLREEIRIKDARLAQIPSQRRPHYPPLERMAILELKAICGWSLAQVARTFLITPETIAKWLVRVDESGPNALVQVGDPVNKFPAFVGYLVRRLRTLCPTLGKAKIAEILARAGLHLGVTTVGRMLKADPTSIVPNPTSQPSKSGGVTAKQPNDVWHVDLTVVPIGGGFWTMWLPNALPQCWPFCWWLIVVVDHYSRRIQGIGTFRKPPTSVQVCALLDHLIRQTNAKPKHLISDKGSQFWCQRYKRWCKRREIKPRFGAVGQHGSIAIVERLIRTIKEILRLTLVPISQTKFRNEIRAVVGWYNEYRPNTSLRGQTPNEIYFRRFPANRKPRYEPRDKWPRGSPCAKPWSLARPKPGADLQLLVEFQSGNKSLPVVRIQRAA